MISGLRWSNPCQFYVLESLFFRAVCDKERGAFSSLQTEVIKTWVRIYMKPERSDCEFGSGEASYRPCSQHSDGIADRQVVARSLARVTGSASGCSANTAPIVRYKNCYRSWIPIRLQSGWPWLSRETCMIIVEPVSGDFCQILTHHKERQCFMMELPL